MRSDDNILARKLLDMRIDVNRIRVQQSCDAHADMLDDVTYEMEEEDMLQDFIKGNLSVLNNMLCSCELRIDFFCNIFDQHTTYRTVPPVSSFPPFLRFATLE